MVCSLVIKIDRIITPDPMEQLVPPTSVVENNDIAEETTKPAVSAISPYDPIFKEVCLKHGNDWRLMSAMAYHESRFTPDITSHQGAQGMMQIMPNVAKYFDVESEDLSNVAINIMVANLLVNRINKMLELPESVSNRDRMSLILASYNGGIGHVFDAQRLARVYGENAYSWEAVSHYLEMKAHPEYYEQDVVRSGKFRGAKETLAYVDDVIGRYGEYCQIAAL